MVVVGRTKIWWPASHWQGKTYVSTLSSQYFYTMEDNFFVFLQLWPIFFSAKNKKGRGMDRRGKYIYYTQDLVLYRKKWAITLALHEDVYFTEEVRRAFDGPRGWYSTCNNIENTSTSSIYPRCTNCPFRIDLKLTLFHP